MRARLTKLLLILALSLAALPSFAQEAKKPPEPLALEPGDMAPDFTLLQYDGQKTSAVSLEDYRGKQNVILAFFVFAFTGG